MGCDIHLYLEKRNKLGKWENSEYTKNKLHLWRSYPMFARLANVRNYWNLDHMPVRGFPINASIDVKKAFFSEIVSTVKYDKLEKEDFPINCVKYEVSGNHSSRHFITDKNMNENKKTKVTIVSDSGCSPVILINKRCYRIRKLTPRECFRLFGLREAEIDTIQAAGISNTQQYKMAGNSIVVDVLYHIFRKLLVDTKADPGTQLELF